MTEQNISTDLVDRLRDAVADVRIPADQAFGIAPQLAELVAQAGFQATTGTIAFAGRYATGEFAVQYNNQNGGFSSVWPQWAFELAKDALLGGKKVWVASNGDPFGSNLVFVMIFG
jgi:hypothetical protein